MICTKTGLWETSILASQCRPPTSRQRTLVWNGSLTRGSMPLTNLTAVSTFGLRKLHDQPPTRIEGDGYARAGSHAPASCNSCAGCTAQADAASAGCRRMDLANQ